MSRKRPRDSLYSDDYKYSLKRDRPDRDTIDSLVYRVGSKDIDKIHKDISELCILFCAELDKDLEHCLDLISSCAKNIPERMEIYSTLLGLINLKNHDFVCKAVDSIVDDLRDALKSSSFDDVRYLVRFLSNSVNSNVIHPASLLSLYENFAEVSLDISSSSQARTDWYTYVILYSLPYSAKRLNEYNSTALSAILSTISVYLSKRKTFHVPMLRVWDSSDPHPQEDYLSCLWSQITSMQKNNWKEHVLWRISDAIPSIRESGQPCEFGQITPPDYDSEIVYPLPQVIFRMFDYTDVYANEDDDIEIGPTKTSLSKSPTLPGAHTVERFLVDEQIHIILETMHFNRAMCARTLLNIQTRAKLPLDYMIVEAIFADVFRLPRPPVRHGNLLFYASLLIQLCNEATNNIPLVLAQATGILFERLDSMKSVCITRFVEWFSFHLINYELKWSWRDWSRALTEPIMSPRRCFISETLCRLVRYSYYENVKQRLPRSFHCLLPPQPGPVNPYDKGSAIQQRIFNRVLEAFHRRYNSNDLLDLIRRLISQKGEESDPETRRRSRSRSGSSNHIIHPEREDIVEADGRRKTKGSRSSSSSSTSSSSKNLHEDSTLHEVGDAEKMEDDEDEFGCCLVPGVTSRELELFMTALLYRAHKTISHTCALLSRYSEAFRTLATTVELQVEALHILQAVWCNQTQMVVAISDYMSRQGMLDPESIVGWAFSPFMSALSGPLAPPPSSLHVRPRMLQSHVWECLMHTLIRVGQRIAQITPKLETARDRLGSHRLKSGSRMGNDDSDEDSDESITDLRDKINRGRRQYQRHRRSRSRESPSPDRLSRLEEERGEALRSQCAVITLLLHRHVRLVATLEEMEASDKQNHSEDLESMAFWLKGRLMQTVLEHQDQLLPYMDSLEELMSDLTPFVRDVFQALRSLYA